jgi:O-antigen ligase
VADSLSSRNTWLLFLFFSANLALPVLDVPLLGLSLTAPILFLICLEVFSRPRATQGSSYARWFVIGYLFLIGLLLSLWTNGIFRGIEIRLADFVTLVRFAYWILAFVTTVIIISSTDRLRSISIIIALAILVLAGMRLYEAVAFGRWGAWTNPRFLSQNAYGIQFSTFMPFALALPFVLRGRVRLVSVIALVLAFIAIAGNGSRASWIGVGLGTVAFAALYAVTQLKGARTIFARLFALAGIVVLLAVLAPPALVEPIVARFQTFTALADDKSYAIRQLMVQKGERMFLESPLFGAGVGRFVEANVELDIPTLLSYGDQDYFNLKTSHNSYIALLGETGLAGTLPFVGLQVLLIFGGLRAVIRLARRGEIWAIAIFASYIGMSVHLWSLSALTGTAPWFVYGLVGGLIEREARLHRQSTPRQ